MKARRVGSLSKYLSVLFFLFLNSQNLFSQSLLGNYTIGGNGPDFNTFQEAINTLVGNGVSGPDIYFHPGTYVEQNDGSDGNEEADPPEIINHIK